MNSNETWPQARTRLRLLGFRIRISEMNFSDTLKWVEASKNCLINRFPIKKGRDQWYTKHTPISQDFSESKISSMLTRTETKNGDFHACTFCKYCLIGEGKRPRAVSMRYSGIFTANLSPFLQIGTITDSHQSLGICSFAHNDLSSFTNFKVSNLPPSLKNNGGSSSSPSALCV